MPTDSAPAADRSRPVLVLWDVDHTLLSIGGGVSRTMYERAFQQVVGRPLGELAHMSGRTEQAIATETLLRNGVPDPDALLAAFYPALAEAARGLAGRMRETGADLPGAREAIAAFAKRDAVQSTVTGNLHAVAEAKLGALGLADGLDLSIGGYGDDGTDRADLVRRAQERAAARHGRPFPGARTVVIGDTVHDVRGARHAGALAVAVATGRDCAADLRAAGADIVLSSLTDHATVTRLLDAR